MSRAGNPVAAATSLGVAAPSTTAANASKRSSSASRPTNASGRIRQTYRSWL